MSTTWISCLKDANIPGPPPPERAVDGGNFPIMNLTHAPATDPVSIYRYRDGLYAADLLACALVYLDFFTRIHEKPRTFTEICADFQIAPRTADVMLTLFRAMGYLERNGEAFQLTNLAREHLVSTSPWYIGPYYASLKERPICKDFLQVLRSDKPANWGSFKDEKEWARAMEDPRFADNFTAAMDCRGIYLGAAVARTVDLSNYKRLLDIAGGSGIYACSLAARFPHLSATVLEKTPVNRIAAQAIEKRGFASRVSVLEQDMFQTSFPVDYDVHIISNVLHDWDLPVVESLLGKSAAALRSGGLLIIHDVHINEEKSGPLPNASYSAMLMHSTEGKCYSTSELHPVLEKLGFGQFELRETAADRSVLLAVKR